MLPPPKSTPIPHSSRGIIILSQGYRPTTVISEGSEFHTQWRWKISFSGTSIGLISSIHTCNNKRKTGTCYAAHGQLDAAVSMQRGLFLDNFVIVQISGSHGNEVCDVAQSSLDVSNCLTASINRAIIKVITLVVEAARPSETLTSIHQTTRCYNAQNSHLQFCDYWNLHCESKTESR